MRSGGRSLPWPARRSRRRSTHRAGSSEGALERVHSAMQNAASIEQRACEQAIANTQSIAERTDVAARPPSGPCHGAKKPSVRPQMPI